jgi:hypothetical protein
MWRLCRLRRAADADIQFRITNTVRLVGGLFDVHA